MAVLEIDSSSPIKHSSSEDTSISVSSIVSRRRDPDAMAASVARLTAENGMPIDQVAGYWGIQKGLKFVNKLLETPTYKTLPPQEREHVLRTAAYAIDEHIFGTRSRMTFPFADVTEKRPSFH